MAAYDDLNEDLHPAFAEDPSSETDAPTSSALAPTQTLIALEKPPETEPDLNLLVNGEIVRTLGRMMHRMEQIADYSTHNLLNVPQTEATLRMLSRSTIDATKAAQECIKLLQTIKFWPACDDVVQNQINRDNGVDALGRPLPDFLKQPRYPFKADVSEAEDEIGDGDDGEEDQDHASAQADYETWQKSFDQNDPS